MDVLDLIRLRAKEGSTPTTRSDPHRLALAVEGGGSRGAYSSGMIVELERRGLAKVFDEVYGSSMGAINAIWLLAGQAEHGVSFFWHPAVMPNVIRPRALLRGKPAVDLRFLTDRVYQRWAGLDFDAVLANPAGLHPIATDADTGEALDLGPFVRDAETVKLAMRGSSGLPLLTGPLVGLGGHRLLDGGLAEAIPYRSALRDGASHVLVLRTRRRDERPKPPSRIEDLAVTGFLRRTAPAAIQPWRGRASRRAEDDERLGAQESGQLRQILVPADAPEVSRLATDGVLIRRAVELGQQAVADTLAEVDC